MSEETEKSVKIKIEDNDAADESPMAVEPSLGGEADEIAQAANAAAQDKQGDADSLKAEIEAAKQASQDNYERFLRVSADFENYKKRSVRDMDNLRKFANETLIRQLLPIADNLERAINTAKTTGDANSAVSPDNGGIIDGVNLVCTEMIKLLEKHGVTPIESLEKPFDPAVHEAVMQEESSEFPGNTVIKEFHKGYLIHDRLLRPAMVVVSKAKPNAGAQTES